jgi:single-strand DNA-binding protein
MGVSVNKVMLIGNLTRDPELRYTPQGSAVCEFAVALNSSYTNKQTGQRVEEVSFIDIVAWARTAEICAEYLKKGRQVFVEGRLKQDRWESPEGKKQSKIRVVADNVQFLGARPAGGGAPGGPSPEGAAEPAPEGTPPPDPDVPF